MWDIVHDLTPTLWQLLPEATIGLRFGTALIGFSLAVGTVIRRLRRRRRTRPSSATVVNAERNQSDQQAPTSGEPKPVPSR